LRRYQQTAVKRAELLTFIGERTVTLGTTLHLRGPLKRESSISIGTSFGKLLGSATVVWIKFERSLIRADGFVFLV
jgi:hypothetical protein